ncbi:hypothetical protein AAF712_001124 [Marasmius tenuissimus]|uniref:Uncharacterized protein n=1 Tax=Marasmius tenuissimus TaxID=585030 RepID=A0ABR3AFW6_9AGAR|nr:hypothetical protein PM082_003088 [Marasmius tenuissimus]
MSLKDHIYTANQILSTPPPPSLRDILTAYRTKGDGDREMLLAMLNAKSAEDNRLAQTASLQRTLLEVYNQPLPPIESVSRKRPRESSPPPSMHYPYRSRVPLSPYSEEPNSPPIEPLARVAPRTSSTRSRSPSS